MATLDGDPFALRRERIDALGTQARALNESIHDLQAQVRRDLPDAEPRGVSVAFGTDGVLESVEIDASLKLTQAQLEEAFSLAVASAPVPRALLAALIADPARMSALRESRSEPLSVYSDERGVVSLLTRVGRPAKLKLGRNALVLMSYSDVADEVVRLARLAAEEGANT